MSKIFNIGLKRGGFNGTQVAVLKAMMGAGEQVSMRWLEEKLDLARLRIYYNLKQLEGRGLVRQDKSGRIYTWALVPQETASASAEIPIEQAYDVIARSASQKLWGIQGAGAVEKLIGHIKKGKSFRPIHQRQRLRQVIVDAILTEKGVSLLKNVPQAELASHLHRPTILHVTPDTPELENLEVISDGKLLLITDRAAGKASVVRDENAVHAYVALHETIKSLSQKVRPQEVYGED